MLPALTRGDIIGLITSYVYAFGMLLLVEALGKRFSWPQYVTRKIIHIDAGMWVWAILALFDHMIYGIIPFFTFIFLNWIFYRKQVFDQMDSESSSPGTVYFALSITILFALLWRTDGSPDLAPIAVAGVMAMVWGDALANLVGRRWGRHTYQHFGHTRSWEGTLAMFLASFAAIFVTLWLLPGSVLSPNSLVMGAGPAAIMAFFAAFVVTFLEAVSPAGTDNLTVPLVTSLSVWLLSLL